MNPKITKMIEKRKRLLRRMTGLDLLVHGSYLERFSTCSRKNCACHQGKKHGPRAYLVVYRDGRQRQVYVPQAQCAAVRKGLRQHEQILDWVRQITDINLALMRASALDQSANLSKKGDPS
jgi:hypothetical protein